MAEVDVMYTRRLGLLVSRYCLFGIAVRICNKAGKVLVRAWWRAARHWNYVFVYDSPRVVWDGATWMSVTRLGQPEQLSITLRIELEKAVGAERVAMDAWEMEHGAALWVARVDGRIAGLSMSRRGDRFRKWFVPLTCDDVVIFRNMTLPGFRGRGVCPSLMRHILKEERRPRGRAFIDCRVYNLASIRSIEKAGFRRIGKSRPLSQMEVLGSSP